MSKNNGTIEELLKEYKFNRARKNFLENQAKRFISDECCRYIINGAVVCEGIPEYGGRSREKIENSEELTVLNYLTGVVEDALQMIDCIDNKYRIVVERYYIENNRMEDIAGEIHISRSKCYDMCKEAVKLMTRVVYGSTPYYAVMEKQVSGQIAYNKV